MIIRTNGEDEAAWTPRPIGWPALSSESMMWARDGEWLPSQHIDSGLFPLLNERQPPRRGTGGSEMMGEPWIIGELSV